MNLEDMLNMPEICAYNPISLCRFKLAYLETS